MGPTGTGKLTIVKNFCTCFPERVLYLEVIEPKGFVRSLADTVGMNIGPSGLLDWVLGHFLIHSVHHLKLLPCHLEGTLCIMKVLEANAKRYAKKHGKLPVLFMNSADMLAKHEPELFIRLFMHTKSMVTN